MRRNRGPKGVDDDIWWYDRTSDPSFQSDMLQPVLSPTSLEEHRRCTIRTSAVLQQGPGRVRMGGRSAGKMFANCSATTS